MRILLVHNDYSQPGGETAVYESERRLLEERGEFVASFVERSGEIRGLGKLSAAAGTVWSEPSRRKIARILQEESVDVVHFHNTFPLISPSAYYACRAARKPVIQTIHNYRLVCPAATLFREGRLCEDCVGKRHPWPGVLHRCYRGSSAASLAVAAMISWHRWMNTWMEMVDLYVTPSHFAKQKMVEAGLPEDRFVIKPNFVHPDPGPRHGPGDYALFVGRLSVEKGIRTVLHAWRRTSAIPLRVIGEGPLHAEVSRFADSSMSGSITMLGLQPRDAIPAIMKGARFLIVPSEWYEPFGLVVVEAFACGVPVIASGIGALAEIVKNDVNGLHVRAGSSEDLAEKVEWLWARPDRAVEMGEAARRTYEERYTGERNYEMLKALYRRAVTSRRGQVG